jgi:phospholipid transport system substrate-binding protein
MSLNVTGSRGDPRRRDHKAVVVTGCVLLTLFVGSYVTSLTGVKGFTVVQVATLRMLSSLTVAGLLTILIILLKFEIRSNAVKFGYLGFVVAVIIISYAYFPLRYSTADLVPPRITNDIPAPPASSPPALINPATPSAPLPATPNADVGVIAGRSGSGPTTGPAVTQHPKANADAGETVQALYDVLLDAMKNGRALGQSGRFAQLEPVIRRTFDIQSMARLSVGSSWATLTEAQRRQVTESFGRYISAIYADRFDSYAGQKLEVTGEQPNADGILVKSQIVKANGEPVKVDYIMRRAGESWVISDIYLDGAISEVATRRAEFAAILRTGGIDGLVAALNRKADLLTGTTARSD